MRDIAKISGVSSATVSRVIKGSNLVRTATAEHVRKVIEETKLVPNGSATSLKYRRVCLCLEIGIDGAFVLTNQSECSPSGSEIIERA
jgi:DNA-binding LacI/PurR family transcriptional regulator